MGKLLLALGITGLAACSGERERNTAGWTTVFDSTGDTIVARITGDVDSVPASRLVLEQRIGEAEGTDSVTFGQIWHIAVTDDNRVFVHDQNGPTVKLFDSTGTLMRFVGRKGAGPGEFEQIAGMDVLPNGQLALWDASHARVNIYSADGEYVRTWRVPVSGFFTSSALRADGTGAIALRIPVFRKSLELGSDDTYVRFDSVGNIRDTIRVPAWIGPAPQLVGTRGNPGQVMVSMTLPMAPQLVHTWSKSGVLVSGPSAPYAVYLTSSSSRPLKLDRAWTAAPVLPEEREELREQVTWQIRTSIPEWTWNGPDVPTSKPAHSRLLTGEDGAIWIGLHGIAERIAEEPAATAGGPNAPPPRRYREPNVYDVFGADGRYLGKVRAESGQALMRMRGNRVWGVLADSLGVPYIARWRVEPPFPL